MGPLSIAAVGWLMGSLVNKAVTELLEAWAKRLGLAKEFKTLKKQLLQVGALLTSTSHLRTDNILLEDLVLDLQQLANKAENLLDELDYYRLQDQIQQGGNHEKENISKKSLVASSSSGDLLASNPIISTLEGIYIRTAPYTPFLLPETYPSITNLSRRMNELTEQLQKSEKDVCRAVKTESLVNITRNTEICHTEATNLSQTSPFHIETREVVGRNEERHQLLNLLTNEESTTDGKVLVLAIIGCGGVGKTTLAGLIFNDPNIESCFDVRSWICVSTRFDIIRFTREMLEGACGNKYNGVRNLEVLQKKLKNKLESKRFLLVLDDMWEDKAKSQWNEMIALLNNCNVKRGIILVTTRNQSVAEMVHARDNIYLQGLDDNAFLSFFFTCIFNDPNYAENSRLRKIGQEIANKLKGNPLAAKTVSALLKIELDVRYWTEIRDSEEWKIQRGPTDIMPALWLSYEHMPFHLQRCFSYCAIFPEDHPFTRTELVYLWMAQGFLDMKSGGKRIEDIGSAYFVDLFNRGFFQTKQSRIPGLVHYTFHDLIHDLACSVASKECLCINGPEPAQLGQIPATIRHLSIFNSSERDEEAIVRALGCLDGENLTTIINSDQLSACTSESISDLLKTTRFLRSMRIKQDSMVHHNYFIQNFVSLRYLSLNFGIFPSSNDTPYYTIPSEICRLYHLQVFQIEAAWNLDELPKKFSDLVSLRHFIVEGYLHSKIWGAGNLNSLQELNYFNVQDNKGFAIEQLGPLEVVGGSLQISNLENVKSKEEASKARIVEKKKLDALSLKWNNGEQENENVLEGLKPNTNLKLLEIHGYGGVAPPTWLDPSLIFLESLTLDNCKAWELLPSIGEFEFLKQLKLCRLPLREIGPQCYGTHQRMKFPSLEELEIKKMPNLEKWVWSDQLQQFLCFKKLKKLTIRGCPKLVDLPLSGSTTSEVLEMFPSLESLKIKDCPLTFQLPPLPYSSLLSFISIARSGFIKSMVYRKARQELSLCLDKSLSLKVGEVLAFHELSTLDSLMISHIPCLESFYELSSLRYLDISHISSMESFHENLVIPHLDILRISHISSLESLDLHSFVALTYLEIKKCQSLAFLTFGDQLVCLRTLNIISCKTLSSMKGLKSWVNLKWLDFRKCSGFIAAWDSASNEIERTEPDFSLTLWEIKGDSLALLTLPICKQLTSLEYFCLEVSAFTEEHEVSPQLLKSTDLVDIEGCKKNLQSFPFDLFPSLKTLEISFSHIDSLPSSSCTEITDEYKKLRNIKEVHFDTRPLRIRFKLGSEEIVCQQTDAVN